MTEEFFFEEFWVNLLVLYRYQKDEIQLLLDLMVVVSHGSTDPLEWFLGRPVPAIRGQEGSPLFGSTLNRLVDPLFAKLAEDGAVPP